VCVGDVADACERDTNGVGGEADGEDRSGVWALAEAATATKLKLANKPWRKPIGYPFRQSAYHRGTLYQTK
jgi:hypothetical protein